MAASRKLLSLLRKQTRSATFQAVLAADKLRASKEPDLEEGQPAETYFVGGGYLGVDDARVAPWSTSTLSIVVESIV